MAISCQDALDSLRKMTPFLVKIGASRFVVIGDAKMSDFSGLPVCFWLQRLNITHRGFVFEEGAILIPDGVVLTYKAGQTDSRCFY